MFQSSGLSHRMRSPTGEHGMGIVHMRPQLPTRIHWHKHVELVLIVQGEGLHLTGNQDLALQAGDIFVIPPGMDHGYGDTTDLELINVCWHAQSVSLPTYELIRLPGYQALFAIEPQLRKAQGFRGHLHVDAELLQTFIDLTLLMQKELSEQLPGYVVNATAILQQLLVHISRVYVDHRQGSEPSLAWAGSVLAYIDAHLHQQLQIDAIAESALVSTPTLQRRFQHHFGCSVLQWVHARRLQQAQELLSGSDLPISGVGQRVGMPDANYFSRWFKKHCQASPSTWRKTYREAVDMEDPSHD